MPAGACSITTIDCARYVIGLARSSDFIKTVLIVFIAVITICLRTGIATVHTLSTTIASISPVAENTVITLGTIDQGLADTLVLVFATYPKVTCVVFC